MRDDSYHRPSAVTAWSDQRVIELLRTSMHPTPRLFPPLDEDTISAEPSRGATATAALPSSMSHLRHAAEVATLFAGPRARRLLSWCTGLWAGAVQ